MSNNRENSKDITYIKVGLTQEEKEKAINIGIKPYSWEEFLHMVGL